MGQQSCHELGLVASLAKPKDFQSLLQLGGEKAIQFRLRGLRSSCHADNDMQRSSTRLDSDSG